MTRERIHEFEDWSSETKKVEPPQSKSPSSSPLRRLSMMVMSASCERRDERGRDQGCSHGEWSPADDDIENRGPSGWLYRENELNSENPMNTMDQGLRCITGKVIYKNEQKPKPGESTVGDGFIEIEPMTHVKHINIHKMGVATSTSWGTLLFS